MTKAARDVARAALRVVDAAAVPLEQILPLREAYRREMNCQIVHDSWHARGFADSYELRVDGELAGYGAVGGAPREARETVKELYLVPKHRAHALRLFRALVEASRARVVEAQTNDVLLSLMLWDSCADLASDTILFEDAFTTTLANPHLVLRAIDQQERDRVFRHTREPVGDWGLELDGEIVATGGLAYHYNPPYADIYMEVAEGARRRGLGSYLIQELKRICREGGHVPAARCHQDNVASRRTLERAGMLPCARIVRGRIASLAKPEEVSTPVLGSRRSTPIP